MKADEPIFPLKPENLLALDPATRCGWATGVEVGTFNLSGSSDESNGMKWIRFWAFLAKMVEERPIKFIGYERPAGKHAGAVIHHAKLAGIIEMFCDFHDIAYCAYSSTAAKKLATGKGNCSKEDVILAAQQQLGYAGDDDNEADALWILQLMREDAHVITS
jgi:Holliday junction resolvasome RuvABC endonuclease subunit